MHGRQKNSLEASVRTRFSPIATPTARDSRRASLKVVGLPHITPAFHRIATASCNIAAKAGQKVPQGFYNLELMVKSVARKGKVLLCGACMDARGLTRYRTSRRR